MPFALLFPVHVSSALQTYFSLSVPLLLQVTFQAIASTSYPLMDLEDLLNLVW
jgi:hypothetical protein